MASVLTRSALVAVALLAGAWLVQSIRAVELESQGREVLADAQRGELGPGEAMRGRDLLQRAQRFNADKAPLLTESFLLRETGQRDEAAELAERAVSEEPDNADGWIILSGVTDDPQRAAQALRMVRALNPLAADEVRKAIARDSGGR
jgi:hypothetical protein